MHTCKSFTAERRCKDQLHVHVLLLLVYKGTVADLGVNESGAFRSLFFFHELVDF